MPEYQAFIVNHEKRGQYVTRIYTFGHDDNLAAWEEEVADDFNEIMRAFGDVPDEAQLVGEAMHVWAKKNIKWWSINVVEPKDPENWRKLTMQRVHRTNTPKRKAS